MKQTLKSSTSLPSYWLFSCAVLVFLMIVIGGLTRLTGSGLSMVEWRPVTGMLPPLSLEEWGRVFALYKNSPEYLKVNFAMSLDDFKQIFWLEYIHRLLGRVIGLVFFVPGLLLFFSKKLDRNFLKPFFILFVLGALQGLLGWYMVKSGLVSDPQVSPYRLAAHLLLALGLYALLLKYALQITFSKKMYLMGAAPKGLLLVATLTLFYGALVAGHKAGLLYNTFPMMGEAWFPDELFFHTPRWRDLFENPVTVQFIHRILALTLLIGVSAEVVRSLNPMKFILLAAVCGQVLLGILTLLHQVPVGLGVLHQAGGVIVLTSLLLYAYTPLLKH